MEGAGAPAAGEESSGTSGQDAQDGRKKTNLSEDSDSTSLEQQTNLDEEKSEERGTRGAAGSWSEGTLNQ
jgi:hypothetical protein